MLLRRTLSFVFTATALCFGILAAAFYECQAYYDTKTDKFLRLIIDDDAQRTSQESVTIKPQSPHYNGPVIALIDGWTVSSGEGVAMGILRAPRGKTLGFHATAGSFGMVGMGGEVVLPGGYGFGFPNGRSLDARGVVQIDSRQGKGGVAPDIRVPLTETAVRDLAGGKDVLLEKALEWLKTNV